MTVLIFTGTIFTGVVLILALILFILSGCRGNKSEKPEGKKGEVVAQKEDTGNITPDKTPEENLKQILEDLKNLERLKEALKLMPEKCPGAWPGDCSAMCYAMSGTPNIDSNFICPKCGEKSIYIQSELRKKQIILLEIEKNISYIKLKTKVQIDVLPSFICEKCKKLVRSNNVALIFIDADKKQSYFNDVSLKDIQLLVKIVNGELVEDDAWDGSSIKDYIPEIKKLLNIK